MKTSQTKMMRYLPLLCLFILCNCKGDDTIQEEIIVAEEELYFPPTNSDVWDTKTIESLNWNTTAAEDLYAYLSDNGTRAFIILKDGKIVVEKYWGNTIQGNSLFNETSNWYWASAGKTLTACLVGVAQQDGLLNINNKTSDYLGANWTSLPPEKEDLITVKHQLTMTTGLDFNVPSEDCTDPECLQYLVDAGTQWYYHNAAYTLLESVVSNAAGISYNDFTDQNIESQTGMNGTWIPLGYNNVYWSTARDAARFGLLLLNEGTWNTTPVLSDTAYFNAMTNSSQSLNPSYGYLCWLNGKSSVVFPSDTTSYPISLAPNAPSDLYAALGKNGQFIDVVPSENLVVIRMGEAPSGDLVPVNFHNTMWEKITTMLE